MRNYIHILRCGMRSILCCLLLGCILLPGGVWADSDARAATPAEKAFGRTLFSAFQRALPPLPPGWTETSRTDEGDADYLIVDEGHAPTTIYEVTWEDSGKLEQAQEEQMRALEQFARQGGASPSPDQTAQASRLEALGEDLAKAIDRGDLAKAAQIQKQMESVATGLQNAGEAQEKQIRELEAKHAATDARVRLNISLNQETLDLSDFVKGEPVNGYPVWQRRETDTADQVETVVFLGPWKKIREDGVDLMRLTLRRGGDLLRAQGLLIMIEAAPERTRKLLAAFRWQALAALLN